MVVLAKSTKLMQGTKLGQTLCYHVKWGVCDTPELWRDAGLCARVRAEALPNIYNIGLTQVRANAL